MMQKSSKPVSLNVLPQELRLMIFSSLDEKDLCSVRRTCKEEYAITQDLSIWRNKIGEHFPYLLETNAKLCKENPEKAYIEEYKSYQKLCKDKKLNCTMQLVFAALNGNLREIDSVSNEDTKQLLYIWSAANGHQAALKKLNLDEKAQAFCFAVKKGILSSVKFLAPMFAEERLIWIDYIESERYRSLKNWALKFAAKKGYFAILECLLPIITEYGDQALTAKGDALRNAAINGQLEIVKYLLKHLPASILKNCCHPLVHAAKHGQLEVVNYLLLAIPKTKLLHPAMGLMEAAKNRQLEAVQLLAQHANINYENKRRAIKYAEKLGFSEIARAIQSTISFRTTLKEYKNFLFSLMKLISIKSFVLPGMLTAAGWVFIKGFSLGNVAFLLGGITGLGVITVLGVSMMERYFKRQLDKYAVSSFNYLPTISALTLEELKAIKTGIKSAVSWKEWSSHIFDINATKHYLCYRAGIVIKSQEDPICDDINHTLKLKKKFSV